MLADDEQVLDFLVVLGGGQGGRVGLEVDLRAGDVVVVAHLVEAAHALPDEIHGGGELHEDAVLDAGEVHRHVQGDAGDSRHGGGTQVVGGHPHEVLVQRRTQGARQARQGQG